MTADEYEQLVKDDDRLALGVPVEVRYTSSAGLPIVARGAVAKLNGKSVVVRLDSGPRVTVPRVSDIKRWSPDQCAITLDGELAAAWAGRSGSN